MHERYRQPSTQTQARGNVRSEGNEANSWRRGCFTLPVVTSMRRHAFYVRTREHPLPSLPSAGCSFSAPTTTNNRQPASAWSNRELRISMHVLLATHG